MLSDMGTQVPGRQQNPGGFLSLVIFLNQDLHNLTKFETTLNFSWSLYLELQTGGCVYWHHLGILLQIQPPWSSSDSQRVGLRNLHFVIYFYFFMFLII
jgi:hypothetical protein